MHAARALAPRRSCQDCSRCAELREKVRASASGRGIGLILRSVRISVMSKALSSSRRRTSSGRTCGTPGMNEAERVAPDMALQMEDALSGNVAEFGGFDGMESVLTCAKPVEHVVAGCVARVDGSALIPISAVDINWTDHEGFFVQSRTRKQVDVGHWFVQTIESVFGLKEADFEGTAARTPRAREGRQNGRTAVSTSSTVRPIC